jgi:hypothetical protein
MRPIVLSQTGTGQTGAVPLDIDANPFNVGIGVVVSGTVTYTIQHTFDDVFDATVTPTWFDHASLAAATASADGNYAFPVTAVRVSVSAGTGTATATILQAG